MGMIKKSNIKKRPPKDKKCVYCQTKTNPVWEEYDKLWEFLTPRGRINTHAFTGLCSKHQRKTASVIKQARHLGLLSFITQE